MKSLHSFSNGVARKLILCSRLATVLAASFLLLPGSGHANTWWVNGSFSGTSNGSQNNPFTTITAAVNASGTCDTIIVESGTYYEAVPKLKAGSTSSPYTLMSASNARVVISAYETLPPAGNWSVYSTNANGTVYTSTANWVSRDMDIGNMKQCVARIPAVGQPWAAVQSATNNTITLTSSLPVSLTGANVGSCFVYAFSGALNSCETYPIMSATGTVITITGTSNLNPGDTLVLANHPSFCQDTGDWAYLALTGSTSQVFYQTSNSSDLNTLQSRENNLPIQVKSVSNVVVNGFEICGATGVGVYITSATNVTVENCVIHQNGMPGGAYGHAGIDANGFTNLRLQNNIICGNYTGIDASNINLGITGTNTGVVILQSDVGFNEADAIDIIGTGSFNVSTNSLIQGCYVHNEVSCQHPDGIQMWADVNNLTIDSCFISETGQNVMASQTGTINLSNNVFYCGLADSVVPGHGTCYQFNFINNTFICDIPNSAIAAGAGVIVTATNDLYYYDRLMFTTGSGSATYATDYSLFWSGTNGDIAGRTSPFAQYTTAAQITSAVGQEQNSISGTNPQLQNVPLWASDAQWGSTTGTLFLHPAPASVNTNDIVEVSGDGIPRTITSVTSGTIITISPALTQQVFRDAEVVDWGPTPQMSGTLLSPLDTWLPNGSVFLTKGYNSGTIGSMIDTVGYVNGEFTGTGIRNIPTMPPEVLAANLTYGSYPYVGLLPYVVPPAITGSMSETGTYGSAFSYQINASNSPTGYGVTGLPAGLSVNWQTGLISGTAQASGTFTITLSAGNAGGGGWNTLTLVVLPPPPVITSSLTATGTSGSAFSYQITASNSPTSYSASGLPLGLSCDPVAGLISGTAAQSGTFTCTISASNAGGTGTANLTVTINPGYLVYEPFEYPLTTNITQVSGSYSVGLTGTTWTGGANAVVAGLSGTGVTSLGNAVQVYTHGGSVRYINIAAMPPGYTGVDVDGTTRLGVPGTTLWFRGLVQTNASISGTLSGQIELCGAASGGTVKLQIGATGKSSNWSVYNGRFNMNGASSTPITTGSTALLVVEVQYSTSKNSDVVNLYVNPPPGVNPPSTPDATINNLSVGMIDHFELYGTVSSTTIDEICMGTSWNSLY